MEKRYEETIRGKVLVYGCVVSVTQKEYLMMNDEWWWLCNSKKAFSLAEEERKQWGPTKKNKT